ncbi:MAG: hypothetical protein M3126_05490 [Candidatus Eremiobacteraeota bacterium]|nr:hypothetical protein [Candidatus Eremiobacteraeota bacterium]
MADTEHSINTYVSDMLALERHINIPFQTQLKDDDFSDYTNARALVSRLADLSNRHADGLKDLLDRLGGHEASPIKSGVSTVEGFVAGAIDKMRKTKVSKALRDDYTALALCTASYTMLTATANALNSPQVAALAQQYLRDYAQCVMEIGQALPAIVVEELQVTGLPVETGTIGLAEKAAQEAWRSGGSTSTAAPTTAGTI